MGKVIKKTRAELRQERLRDHDGLTKAQAIKLELVDEDYTPKKPKKPNEMFRLKLGRRVI